MDKNLSKLAPAAVWKNFEGLCQYPHPSNNEEAARVYIRNFIKSIGLDFTEDEAHNNLVRKPAPPGMENRKTIVLQDHVHMVPQKNTDKEFEEKFINVLRKQIGSMDILDFPFTSAWNRLKEKLQNMEAPYIFADKFHEYCDECGVTDSSNIRRDLLNWFSDLGVSFCYSGSASLEDYVVRIF